MRQQRAAGGGGTNRLEAALDTAGLLRLVADREGRILEVNEALARTIGWSRGDLVGASAPERLVHPDARPQVEQALARIDELDFPYTVERLWQTKAGEPLLVAVSAGADRDAAGRVQRIELIGLDLTERKRVEDELARSLASLQATLDATADGILVLDEEAEIVGWNRRFAELWGLPPDLLATGDNERILPEALQQLEDPASVARDAERLYAGTYEDGFSVLRFRDGRVLERTSIPRSVGDRPDGRVFSFRDVTERDRREQELRRQAFLLANINDALVITDEEHGITFWNRAAEELYGRSAAEVLGGPVPDAVGSRLSADEQDEVRRTLDEEGAIRRELPHTRADGSPIVVESRIIRIRDDAGVVGHVAVHRDVTERKQLEARLRQAQKLEALGQLAGGVAHDFNNILTAIHGFAELVLDRADDPGARRHLADILAATQRAGALTRQLLAFSRRQVLKPAILDPNEVVARVESMLERLLPDDIDVRCELGDGLGSVQADPSQLEQVVVNLAVNARDAMPAGGRLTIETGAVEIGAGHRRDGVLVRPGPYVRLSVSDTGGGIPAEALPRIFEPFFTTKPAGEGTGLGLSTVYGIVKQSEGYVWARSEPGAGTTFDVYLPRVDAPAERDEAPEPARPARAGEGTILVVEDEEQVRRIVCEVLEEQGYRVLAAAQPGRALELAGAEERVDLLLTDVVMPGASGRELADRIAEQHPEARVVYMSGYAESAVVHRGVIEPGTSFLQKPFSLAELAGFVETTLAAPS
jgi:PAS domain S-box-containing protein